VLKKDWSPNAASRSANSIFSTNSRVRPPVCCFDFNPSRPEAASRSMIPVNSIWLGPPAVCNFLHALLHFSCKLPCVSLTPLPPCAPAPPPRSDTAPIEAAATVKTTLACNDRAAMAPAYLAAFPAATALAMCLMVTKLSPPPSPSCSRSASEVVSSSF
ncbi:unnamed protein product, partial [Ectocarpus sp. 12 AP-2014]